MKEILLSIVVIVAAAGVQAQSVVKDSVILGAGYANQTWYSLKNDEQGSRPKNEWDVAFKLTGISSTVFINPAVTLWGYPKSTIAGWASVDTSGLHTWMKRYNTDESWDIGAIGRYADPNNGNDLDWGVYDMGTHHITGDSIFIIKLADGTYKKFAVESLISGTFTFKYANLDGSNEQQKTIKKTDYADRMFAYVSMQNNQLLNREPAKDKWDLLFTQYTNMAISYTVTGVLQNKNVEIAEVNGLSNKETYNDYFNHTYSDNISTIGYDWKTFDMQNNVYKIKDSTVYLVLTQDQGDEYWKMLFTGFDNTNGKFAFTKQRLFSTSINDNAGNNAASMTVFPNPATGAAINIAYNLVAAAENAALYVHDIDGRVVYTSQLDKTMGMHQHVFSTASMPAGNYIVSIAAGTLRMQQQLSVVK